MSPPNSVTSVKQAEHVVLIMRFCIQSNFPGSQQAFQYQVHQEKLNLKSCLDEGINSYNQELREISTFFKKNDPIFTLNRNSASPEMLVSTSEQIAHRHLHRKAGLGRHILSTGPKVPWRCVSVIPTRPYAVISLKAVTQTGFGPF